jgi:hypothetical protein
MASERKTYVLKVRKKQGRLWVLFDEQHLMEGKPGETQGELVARWRDVHGPTGCLVEYVGTHTVADLTAKMEKVRAENSEQPNVLRRLPMDFGNMSLGEQLRWRAPGGPDGAITGRTMASPCSCTATPPEACLHP